MKIKCLKCGKVFIDKYDDNYSYINDNNKRVLCNGCVKKEWAKFRRAKL